MRGDLTTRNVKTASGATAVQVVRYEGKRCIVVKHIGSAHDDATYLTLREAARSFVQNHCSQPDLFESKPCESNSLLHLGHSKLHQVTHLFARNTLIKCAHVCGLEVLPELYLDLALIVIYPTNIERSCVFQQNYYQLQFLLYNGNSAN